MVGNGLKGVEQPVFFAQSLVGNYPVTVRTSHLAFSNFLFYLIDGLTGTLRHCKQFCSGNVVEVKRCRMTPVSAVYTPSFHLVISKESAHNSKAVSGPFSIPRAVVVSVVVFPFFHSLHFFSLVGGFFLRIEFPSSSILGLLVGSVAFVFFVCHMATYHAGIWYITA